MDADPRARLERLSSSAIADAQQKKGVLPPRIARLAGSGTVAGPAITASCDAGSVAAVLRALADAAAGDVLVVQGPGDWAYFGELTGAEAARIGLAAIVADCRVRDFERLSTLGVAVFAHGLAPLGAAPSGSGHANVPLRVGDVTIAPGDWVVADVDGVAVVSRAELDEVVARTEEIAAVESECFAAILGGRSLLDHDDADGTPLGAVAAATPSGD